MNAADTMSPPRVLPELHDDAVKRGLPFPEFIFVVLACVFYINFQIQARYQISSPFIALGYLAYCGFVMPRYRNLIICYVGSCLLIAIMYQFMTIPVTVRGSDVEMKYFYSNFSQYLLVFFPLAIYYRVQTYAGRWQTRIIFGVILLSSVFLIQAALAFTEINADILHTMDRKTLDDAEVDLQGYSYVYAFTFLIITCLALFRKARAKVVKYFSAAAVAYFVYFLFKAQFALAFVTTFISCLYLYYVTTRNRHYRVLVIIGLVALYFMLPSILEYFIELTRDSNVLNVRLREIYDSLTGNHSHNSDMQARFDLYRKCIEAFLYSPIWGNRYLDFNGHSTFLLGFAYLGIFGGTFICYTFYRAAKFVKAQLGDNYLYYKPLMLQLILMGITNPIQSCPSNFIMLFFVCPLLIHKYLPQK